MWLHMVCAATSEVSLKGCWLLQSSVVAAVVEPDEFELKMGHPHQMHS